MLLNLSDNIFDFFYYRVPLILLLFIEGVACIAVIAGGLFNCDIIYGGCKGTFFSQHYSSNPVLVQPYPTILPILFFALLIIAILVPVSTLLLISTKSKKIIMFKVILYLVLILIANFYGKISGKIPGERLKCDFYSCESFNESVIKTEKASAEANNLIIYQPTYLPEAIKNAKKTQTGYFPYMMTYDNRFAIIEEPFSKLSNCGLEKNRYMNNGTCEEIKDGELDARYTYKKNHGSTNSFLTWNKENTRIILEFYYNPLPISEQIKIAKSFE